MMEGRVINVHSNSGHAENVHEGQRGWALTTTLLKIHFQKCSFQKCKNKKNSQKP